MIVEAIDAADASRGSMDSARGSMGMPDAHPKNPNVVVFKRTGDVLVEKGLITKDQLYLCLKAQQSLTGIGRKTKIGEIILDYGFCSQTDVELAISSTGAMSDSLGGYVFPVALLKRLKVFPMSLNDGVLRVAAAGSVDATDKLDLIAAAEDLGLSVHDVKIVPKDRMEVLVAINSLFAPDSVTVAAEINELDNRKDDSTFITQIIQNIYLDALQSRASDIHMLVSNDPEFNWIAYRIDGAMHYSYMASPESMAILATRIKSDSGMDFSDTMRPHDGRTSVRYNGKIVDIRVSTLPVDFGETVVLRLLDSSAAPSIDRLFSIHEGVAQQINNIVEASQKNGGVFLVTGATGSGKSTTLNAILRGIDRSQRSIKTVEDPVELRVPLVGHTQVNEIAGLSYSSVLRALLRQDPDVIMVGELRDSDTVETALRAAETGHMMLSTLHTGSVAESVTRLLGMMSPEFRSIGKFILAGTLKGVINQKLGPKLCAKCCIVHQPDPELLSLLRTRIDPGQMPRTFYTAVGCVRCNGSGYLGRVVIPEALFIPGDSDTRTKVEEVLIHDRSFRDVMALPGVVWYKREQALATALLAGLIDPITALALLDIRPAQRGAGRRSSDQGRRASDVARSAPGETNRRTNDRRSGASAKEQASEDAALHGGLENEWEGEAEL
jgi:type II secretory ATPase GspE/PulE/Tfp pilus assembly ATPase PilB-like protein